MKQPLISVVIPTHNRAHLLPKAVESALAAGSNVEVVVVDDASTDDTPEVCRGLERIRYLRLDRNLHVPGARNEGIKLSRGEYVAFLDDDDLRLPGSLDRQLKLLRDASTASLCYGPVKLGDPETNEPTGELSPTEVATGDLFWQLLEGNFIHTPSVLARTQLVKEVGMFDPTVPGVEDWMLWIRLAENHDIVAIHEPAAIYRLFTNSSQQLSSNRAAMCAMSARVQAKGLKLPRARKAPTAKRKEIRRRFLDMAAEMLVIEAATGLAHANYGHALKDYLTAVKINARSVLRPHAFRTLLDRPAAGRRKG